MQQSLSIGILFMSLHMCFIKMNVWRIHVHLHLAFLAWRGRHTNISYFAAVVDFIYFIVLSILRSSKPACIYVTSTSGRPWLKVLNSSLFYCLSPCVYFFVGFSNLLSWKGSLIYPCGLCGTFSFSLMSVLYFTIYISSLRIGLCSIIFLFFYVWLFCL